jgi:hypothetical protein
MTLFYDYCRFRKFRPLGMGVIISPYKGKCGDKRQKYNHQLTHNISKPRHNTPFFKPLKIVFSNIFFIIFLRIKEFKGINRPAVFIYGKMKMRAGTVPGTAYFSDLCALINIGILGHRNGAQMGVHGLKTIAMGKDNVFSIHRIQPHRGNLAGHGGLYRGAHCRSQIQRRMVPPGSGKGIIPPAEG